MIWTAEQVDALTALWAEGRSASIISTMMGMSRNAVIGKVNRLRLPQRDTTEAKRRRITHIRPRGIKRLKLRLVKPERAPKPKSPKVIDFLIPHEQRKSLLELTAHTCRWPVGDPGTEEFFFCGAEPMEGGPYCPGHHARGVVPTRELPIKVLAA